MRQFWCGPGLCRDNAQTLSRPLPRRAALQIVGAAAPAETPTHRAQARARHVQVFSGTYNSIRSEFRAGTRVVDGQFINVTARRRASRHTTEQLVSRPTLGMSSPKAAGTTGASGVWTIADEAVRWRTLQRAIISPSITIRPARTLHCRSFATPHRLPTTVTGILIGDSRLKCGQSVVSYYAASFFSVEAKALSCARIAFRCPALPSPRFAPRSAHQG
jgi:hypothetical protein